MIAVTIFSNDNTCGFCLVYLFLFLLIFMVTGRPSQGNILSSLLIFLKLIFPLAPFGSAAMAIIANSSRFL